jgi:5-methylcytosine-specific restriction endonuclease McrA
MAAASREWARANPGKIRIREARRQELNNGFVITDDLKRRLLGQQHHLCALCGTAINGLAGCDVDHLIPLAKGGSNHESNLVAAHRQCNREKCAKTLREYHQWRQLNRLPRSTFQNEKTLSALGHETRRVS